MQASEDPPSTDARNADLSRLRIARGSEDGARTRGFPWTRLLLLLGLVVLLMIFREPLLGLFQGESGASVKTAGAEKVVPGQAEQGDVSANGYIVADKQASLASVISGRLVELHAAVGDTVEANAVVARIQYDDLEAQESQAAARTKAAEARLEEAQSKSRSATARVVEAQSEVAAARLSSARLAAEKAAQDKAASQTQETVDRLAREVERNRPLYRKRLIDAGTWDRVQTEARAAQKSLEAAQARVRATSAAEAAWVGQIARRVASQQVAQHEVTVAESAESIAEALVAEAKEAVGLAAILVEKTRIRAPFTGLVVRKDAEKGEVIAPTGAGNSRGSVLTIVDPKSLEVQVELSERRIARVREGDRAVVFLDAAPDEGLPGTVRKIWPRADRSKGSIEVRVTISDRPAHVRPEMAARVVFKGSRPATQPGEAYVRVPRAAVVKRGSKDVVFVLSGGVVKLTPVRLGAERGTDVTILEGLDGGETVIIDPATDLVDGSRVNKES